MTTRGGELLLKHPSLCENFKVRAFSGSLSIYGRMVSFMQCSLVVLVVVHVLFLKSCLRVGFGRNPGPYKSQDDKM